MTDLILEEIERNKKDYSDTELKESTNPLEKLKEYFNPRKIYYDTDSGIKE